MGESLGTPERFRIPLLDKLVPGGIRFGTVFMVEFDPHSQWLAVSTTMAAGYLRANGRVLYIAFARPVVAVRQRLEVLGLDVLAAEQARRLDIEDWHSASLSGGRIESALRKSEAYEPTLGGTRVLSMKIHDLSVAYLKGQKEGWQDDVSETWPAGALSIGESVSELLRFNEETPVVEFLVSRVFPHEREAGRITMGGFVRGIHSESFYRRIEAACDGLIEVRVMEREDMVKNLVRVTSLKGQPHDTRWHEIEIKPNGEAVLVT